MDPVTVLIVEDHPIMLSNYKKSIIEFSKTTKIQYDFDIHLARNAKEAYDQICTLESIDLILLDISIPEDVSHQLYTGEDVGKLAKTKFPDLKIIVLTSLTDTYRLANIVKTLSPSSVMIKSELTLDELTTTFCDVLQGKKKYSAQVSKIVDSLLSDEYGFIDEIDRQIMHEISLGSKLMEMADVLKVSKANIDQRKRKLKEAFDVESDRDLMIEAKKRGFI